MLQIEIPDAELFDDETQSFITVKRCRLQLEHSLVSLSKWESKWKKPFLRDDELPYEETIDYIRCMTMTQNVDPNVYRCIPDREMRKIKSYIEDKMTATWFNEKDKKSPKKDVITSEIIYYWMISQNIPFECQKWHLNRLLTLIRVCSIKNAPPKKSSKRDNAKRRSELNAARLKKFNTTG